MARQRHKWEEVGIIPLHEHAGSRVGIIAGPEFVEVSQRAVVHPPAAAGAEHQLGLRKGRGRFIHEGIERVDVINPEMRLAVRREPGRSRLGEVPVAIPLGVTDARHAEHVVDDFPFELLHLGPREVEHELVAL